MSVWMRMTGEDAVLREDDALVAAAGDRVHVLAKLPDRLARHHRNGKRDVDAARSGLHRDGQARIRRLVDGIRHACGFAAEQENVVAGKGEIRVSGSCFGRQQHQPPLGKLAPVLEGVPVDMSGERRHFEVVHAGPFQRPVTEREARRFDNVDAETEASGEAQDCPVLPAISGW